MLSLQAGAGGSGYRRISFCNATNEPEKGPSLPSTTAAGIGKHHLRRFSNIVGASVNSGYRGFMETESDIYVPRGPVSS